jgi:hypothetical protein
MPAPNLLGRCRQQTRDRNNIKWNDGKMKKGWKSFSPQK